MNKVGVIQQLRQAITLSQKFYRGRADKKSIVTMILSSVAINIAALVFPMAILQYYDRIIPGNSFGTLFSLGLIVFFAVVFEATLRTLRTSVSSWLDAKYQYQTSCNAIKSILNSDITEFEKNGAGTYMERMNALGSIKEFYGGEALNIIFDLPFIILYLILITVIGGPLVFIPLAFIVLLFIAANLFGKKIQSDLDKRTTTDERYINFIIEVLIKIHTVKALVMEGLIERRHERLQQHNANINRRLSYDSAISRTVATTLSQLNMITVVSIGAILVMGGSMTVGGLAACTLLANRSLHPLSKTMSIWKRLQAVIVSENQLNSVLTLSSESQSSKQTFCRKRPIDISGNIEIKNLKFRHKNCDHPVINDLNLTVNSGEMIGISGNTASGRTTLLMLLIGILKPSSGEILYDNNPVSNMDMEFLRKNVVYVPQNGQLFDGTILENITLFRNAEKFSHALKVISMLGLDRTINQFPDGFDTRIGIGTESTLPAGLRQRIVIARSLIDEPKIILFDEANSNIDIQSDKYVKNTIEKTKGKATIILITHRPSILNLSDRILTFENGKLKETVCDNRKCVIAK